MVIESVPEIPEPSFAVAFAVTVPLAMAATSPDALIDAWPVPLISDHVTVLVVAFAGVTAALN